MALVIGGVPDISLVRGYRPRGFSLTPHGAIRFIDHDGMRISP